MQCTGLTKRIETLQLPNVAAGMAAGLLSQHATCYWKFY